MTEENKEDFELEWMFAEYGAGEKRISNVEPRNNECRSGQGGHWDFRLSILDCILNLNRP